MITIQVPEWLVVTFTFLALIVVLQITFLICVAGLLLKLGQRILKQLNFMNFLKGKK